jgi:enamine deaminase RidA (YjgF/YER057c/UK114 family)
LRAGNRVWITGTAPVAEDGGVTMVEVSRLIDPDMLIEIEADAIVTN